MTLDDHEPIIVIGSGPAGAAAANALAHRGLPVVVLDAGVRAPRGVVVRAAGNTVFRYQEPAVIRATDRNVVADDIAWFSSLTNGGLSNYWTGSVPRYAPSDFDEGATIDDALRWPIAYDDLVDDYAAVESLLDVTAGAPIIGIPSPKARRSVRLAAEWCDVGKQLEANGIGFGAMPMAKGSPWMFALRGTEFSSYHCVLRSLRRLPAFDFRPGAIATRLIWSPSVGRVTAVEYRDRGSGELRSQPARAVFVACGAVDSVRLLLRSRSGDHPSGLGNSRDLVGRYLHDHPQRWQAIDLSQRMPPPWHPIYLPRASHDESEPLLAASCTLGLVTGRDRVRSWFGISTDQIAVKTFGTMVPRPDTRVTESDAIDPVDGCAAAMIELEFDGAVHGLMRRTHERFNEAMHLGGLRVAYAEAGPLGKPGASVHLGGGARMHEDPDHGVVDADNRLHDAPNVLVVDSSCFTTGPEKNPVVTSMAIAHRAARRFAATQPDVSGSASLEHPVDLDPTATA